MPDDEIPEEVIESFKGHRMLVNTMKTWKQAIMTVGTVLAIVATGGYHASEVKNDIEDQFKTLEDTANQIPALTQAQAENAKAVEQCTRAMKENARTVEALTKQLAMLIAEKKEGDKESAARIASIEKSIIEISTVQKVTLSNIQKTLDKLDDKTHKHD